MNDNLKVVVMQHSIGPTWFIRLDAGRLIPRRDAVPDWATCPGSLYQDFPTSEKACEVARWWGFEPVIREDYTHKREYTDG